MSEGRTPRKMAAAISLAPSAPGAVMPREDSYIETLLDEIFNPTTVNVLGGLTLLIIVVAWAVRLYWFVVRRKARNAKLKN
jgi:hypothetical protein